MLEVSLSSLEAEPLDAAATRLACPWHGLHSGSLQVKGLILLKLVMQKHDGSGPGLTR